MEVTLPISSLIIIAMGSVGVTVSIFMGILLLAQKEKKHISISLLAWLLLLSGSTLLNDVLVTSGISNRIQWLYFIPIYYSLSIAPLFYLFIKSKFSLRLDKRDYIHLIIPAIQAAVYLVIGFRSVSFKSMLWSSDSFRFYLLVESFLFPISLVAYSLMSLYLLHTKDDNHFFWSADIKIWLKKFVLGMLLIAGMEFSFSLVEYNSTPAFSSAFPFYLVHSFTLSAFVFWISINGFKQYFPLQIFTSKPITDSQLIDEQELSDLVKKLSLLMTKDKVFLNPDLNLELLANYLDISTKRCSYVLNNGVNANFNNYVNAFRIEAFKEKIEAGKNQTFTLTSLAFECGFDSKSTFNRVFKTICGITPSEYIKMTQSSKSE